MALPNDTKVIEQLKKIIETGNCHFPPSRGNDYAEPSANDLQYLVTSAIAAIDRIAGRSSAYARSADDCMATGAFYSRRVHALMGVVEALKTDIEAGYLATLRELVHAELFADFLDMASHLLDEGYKDAAAVIGGSSLESHLRLLCVKNNIPVTTTSASSPRPKKADALNSELAEASVYSKLDQKSVTSWLDLRNKAAHGHYSDYSKEQVALFLQGIQDFMVRNQA